MLKGKQKSDPNEANSSFRPLVYIGAFFHPVSRKSLNDTLKKNQETQDRVEKLITDTDELHRKVDAALAGKPG